ncbi:Protein CBG12731 [Caenorhabditis briggsae]|uniref:Protein CBG12731 n=1 Tax=Caenorhabditis briggsae TaxID=6238 RepID=A8XGG1_CAEBR|nr:Protein CBG12731 [Caenorhabditis briggsae]CAP31667.1 Protein CBG12731 [Caenorhabditis briggsae]
MVELGGNGPYSTSFDNSVFIIPAIVIVALFTFAALKLRDATQGKEKSAARARRDEKKKAK